MDGEWRDRVAACVASSQWSLARGADVSLSIEPGEVVAFVGETGSGKTSIANLVCGFYEPDSGDVLIDGRSHADVTHADWRQVAAFEDSGLLQRSVRDAGDVWTCPTTSCCDRSR